MSASADLPLTNRLDRAERRVVPSDATVHSLIEQQARATPNAIAVVCGDEELTYAALNAQADDAAHRMQSRGVRPGDIVGISVDRGLHRIVGLLGILKAGAAYLPLDPDYPSERLAFMLSDSQARLLLTERRFSDRFRENAIDQLLIDDDADPVRNGEPNGTQTTIDGGSLCYVIYTSGSTGRPKGVAVSHRAAAHLVWRPDFVDFDASDCFLHHTSMSFDPSVCEIWTPLVNGGRLAVVAPGRVSLTGLGRTIRRHAVSILLVVTPLFHALVDECLDELTSLKTIISGGEAFSIEHVRRAVAALPDTRLSLCYGPTENSVITTCYQPRSVSELAGRTFVPLGRLLAGSNIHVLDEQLAPVPSGAAGELYCSGLGLAEGYLHRPDLTAERFVQLTAPNGETTRAYRTGDLVRHHDGDVLEFIGRVDQQVKIRGFRVELGEIEAALLQHPRIRQCAVVAQPSASQTSALVAWLVPTPDATMTRRELQEFLGQSLPGYMVPERYLRIERLPLTPNGKVDRTALRTGDVPSPPEPLS